MGRVLIRKSDGRPIEYQSTNAPLGTLKQNAVNAGLNPDDYTEQYISEGEYQQLLIDTTPVPTEDEINEKKIQNEIFDLQRAGAIDSLKGKGELPDDYKDKKDKKNK